MVPFNIFCGSCWYCARGLYSNCHNVNPNATAVGGIYGYSHTTGGYDGGQADYVRVPFADVGPTVIPGWMSDEDAVLLTDAVPTGYFGAQYGEIAEGDTVGVVGAYGPVPNAVEFGDALNKGLTLRMNQCPVKRQWPRLFEHDRNGTLRPSELVTHRFPLEEISEGYHIFSAKLDGCIKPLVVPSAA